MCSETESRLGSANNSQLLSRNFCHSSSDLSKVVSAVCLQTLHKGIFLTECSQLSQWDLVTLRALPEEMHKDQDKCIIHLGDNGIMPIWGSQRCPVLLNGEQKEKEEVSGRTEAGSQAPALILDCRDQSDSLCSPEPYPALQAALQQHLYTRTSINNSFPAGMAVQGAAGQQGGQGQLLSFFLLSGQTWGRSAGEAHCLEHTEGIPLQE